MTTRGLIDTGALLALLDRGDRWHAACVTALAGIRLPLGTSAAVLAELFHLLHGLTKEADAAWELIRSNAIVVLSIDGQDLEQLEVMMKKYTDRPMDFADATLVRLADRESLSVIFTIDHDDFETYRIGGRKRFNIVPAK